MRNLKQVKFSKSQIALLQQMLSDANKAYDAHMVEKPYVYDGSSRDAYICSYVKAFIESLAEFGFGVGNYGI